MPYGRAGVNVRVSPRFLEQQETIIIFLFLKEKKKAVQFSLKTWIRSVTGIRPSNSHIMMAGPTLFKYRFLLLADAKHLDICDLSHLASFELFVQGHF